MPMETVADALRRLTAAGYTDAYRARLFQPRDP